MRDSGLSLEELLLLPAAELRLVGAEENDENSEENSEGSNGVGEENESESSEENSEEDSDDDSDESEDDKPKGDPQRKIAALEDEKNRHLKQRRKAEQRVTELETELSDLKNKGLDESGKAELARLKDENSELRKSVKSQALESAFFRENTYKWHSPAHALKLADLSDVEIEEDGTVNGLKTALQHLAETSPFLLAESVSNEEETKNPPKPSGKPPRKRQSSGDSSASKVSQYKNKYPGLRR